MPSDIVTLTGITDELLAKHGEDIREVIAAFFNFSKDADYFMAHNAPFDRGFIDKLIKAYLIANWNGSEVKWIDTSVDVDYPEHIKTRKLSHLASEHGFVNPFAHRAVTDVLTMFAVTSRYSWSEIIKNAETPNITMRAMTVFKDNDKAKSLGYRFDKPNTRWIKQIKEHRMQAEVEKAAKLGFKTVRVG